MSRTRWSAPQEDNKECEAVASRRRRVVVLIGAAMPSVLAEILVHHQQAGTELRRPRPTKKVRPGAARRCAALSPLAQGGGGDDDRPLEVTSGTGLATTRFDGVMARRERYPDVGGASTTRRTTAATMNRAGQVECRRATRRSCSVLAGGLLRRELDDRDLLRSRAGASGCCTS